MPEKMRAWPSPKRGLSVSLAPLYYSADAFRLLTSCLECKQAIWEANPRGNHVRTTRYRR